MSASVVSPSGVNVSKRIPNTGRGVTTASTALSTLALAPSTAFRKHSRTICKANNVPNYFDITGQSQEGDIKDNAPKRGVLKRIKDKLSGTFGGDEKIEDDDTNDEDIGYRPNIMDTIRLRLAMTMSGLSNLPLFQRSNKEWVVACPKTRVGPGQIVPCVVNGLDIIIFASRDGQRLDAFANSCPHLGSPFDLATVERQPVTQERNRADDGVGDGCVDCIVCPVHRTAFEIQSGDVRGEWCPYPPVLGGIMGYVKPKSGLVKFAVRLKGKNVEVRVATSLKNVEGKNEGAEGMRNIK